MDNKFNNQQSIPPVSMNQERPTPSATEINTTIETGKQNFLLFVKSNPMIVVIALAIVLLIGGFIVLGISNNQKKSQYTSMNIPNTTEPSPTNTLKPTDILTPEPSLTTQQIMAKFDKEGQVVTVADIYKTPNLYKDKPLIFNCTVSGFPKNAKGDVVGLNCNDPSEVISIVQIAIRNETDITKINQNDTIKVYGLGEGALQGKNAFGADVTFGGVLDFYIDDLTSDYKNY